MDLEKLNTPEQQAKRDAVVERDKKHGEAIDAFTEELVGELAKTTKALDQAFKAAGGGEHLRNLEYVEREEDEELKAMYEKEKERV